MKIALALHDAAATKPDADETVLLFNNSWDEPCWPGYWNGEGWCDPDNLAFVDHRDPEPTHWARMPHLDDAKPSAPRSGGFQPPNPTPGEAGQPAPAP